MVLPHKCSSTQKEEAGRDAQKSDNIT